MPGEFAPYGARPLMIPNCTISMIIDYIKIIRESCTLSRVSASCITDQHGHSSIAKKMRLEPAPDDHTVGSVVTSFFSCRDHSAAVVASRRLLGISVAGSLENNTNHVR